MTIFADPALPHQIVLRFRPSATGSMKVAVTCNCVGRPARAHAHLARAHGRSLVSCPHPVRRMIEGWGWHCQRCNEYLGPVSPSRPCGCPADPVVFGHICGR